MTTKFSIARKNEIKRNALTNALAIAGLRESPVVLCDAISSGVNAQPVGIEEISRGAHNRAAAAAKAVPGSIGVGIENGIVQGWCNSNEDESAWSDVAMVVLILPDGREFARWSQVVEIPREQVVSAGVRGFETTTVGMIIAESHGGSSADPHSTLTDGKFSREKLLTDALVAALQEAKTAAMQLFGEVAETFAVTIGTAKRSLPIRKVAPTVRVALFNILGDWELTEAAGKVLAPKMRGELPSFDALVMPDGKATALLHVLGRELRLPTFVARKQLKPYDVSGARSVTYRSITTDTDQSLHITAEAVAKLRGKRVVIVDDVISTGGTVVALTSLLKDIGANVVGLAAIFCEGKNRSDVCSLGVLPLF